jgi:hypothetical protein
MLFFFFFGLSFHFGDTHVEVIRLHSNHEIEDDKCAEKHNGHAVEVKEVRIALRRAHLVHEASPPFKRNQLEREQQGITNIVHVGQAELWVAHLDTTVSFGAHVGLNFRVNLAELLFIKPGVDL